MMRFALTLAALALLLAAGSVLFLGDGRAAGDLPHRRYLSMLASDPANAPAPNLATATATRTSAPAPTNTPDPGAPTARCKDGTLSYSKTASGTCSGHGGVDYWINHP